MAFDPKESLSIRPYHIITYPVGSDETGGRLMLFGKPTANRIAIMCAGFPSDHACLFPLANRLAKEMSYLVGVMCLPGYDDSVERPWHSFDKNGYKTSAWVSAVREAVKALRGHSLTANAKLTGIFHDWGVVAGLCYTNRVLMMVEEKDMDKNNNDHDSLVPDELILFDVLLGVHPKSPGLEKVTVPDKTLWRKFFEWIVTHSYRLVLAKCFWMQRYVSSTLAWLQLGVGFAILSALNLVPTYPMDVEFLKDYPIQPHARLLYMAYPYYNIFRSILTGTVKEEFYGARLPVDLQRIPVLYLYGENKRIPFHVDEDVEYLRMLSTQEGQRSNAVAVKKAGHWLFLQEPDECFAAIKKFLS